MNSLHHLPTGLKIHNLETHSDDRGCLTEVFRQSWISSTMLQWNFVKSKAGVMRGVHLHRKHADYLILIEGKMLLCLKDIRISSPTENKSYVIELNGAEPKAILIPTGIMHGFYFPEASLHAYAVSSYFDPKDEMGCHWADADLDIPWSIDNALLSHRDENAPSFRELMESIDPFVYSGTQELMDAE